ncbi:MAG: hypothetical protein CMC82_00540 [Flavobacteriaceae bacterium]|nr:hypothetical protein [Flavobacteriaceae bacterium]
MKKSELKSIIKECVKEILFEEGVLSNLVAEVAFGITKAQNSLVENRAPKQDPSVLQEARQEQEEVRRKRVLETKRKMLDAIGNSKMANVFEGTEPLREGGTPTATPAQGPMAGRDPNDAGVDISGLFSVAGAKWNALK